MEYFYGLAKTVVKKDNELFCFINTNEIPGELSCENRLTLRVKRSQLLWLHNKSHLS